MDEFETMEGAQVQEQGQDAAAGGETFIGGEAQQTEQAQETVKPQAPEMYQAFVTPGEMQIDEASHAEFSALARELNLTQEQAQKLVDYHAKHWMGAVAEMEQQLQRRVAEWETKTKSHPEFGGSRYEESLRHARRFVERFGGDDLRAALNETGTGSHPALFAAFARAGQMLAEDRFTHAAFGGEDDSPQAVARRMYNGIQM